MVPPREKAISMNCYGIDKKSGRRFGDAQTTDRNQIGRLFDALERTIAANEEVKLGSQYYVVTIGYADGFSRSFLAWPACVTVNDFVRRLSPDQGVWNAIEAIVGSVPPTQGRGD